MPTSARSSHGITAARCPKRRSSTPAAVAATWEQASVTEYSAPSKKQSAKSRQNAPTNHDTHPKPSSARRPTHILIPTQPLSPPSAARIKIIGSSCSSLFQEALRSITSVVSSASRILFFPSLPKVRSAQSNRAKRTFYLHSPLSTLHSAQLSQSLSFRIVCSHLDSTCVAAGCAGGAATSGAGSTMGIAGISGSGGGSTAAETRRVLKYQ